MAVSAGKQDERLRSLETTEASSLGVPCFHSSLYGFKMQPTGTQQKQLQCPDVWMVVPGDFSRT